MCKNRLHWPQVAITKQQRITHEGKQSNGPYLLGLRRLVTLQHMLWHTR